MILQKLSYYLSDRKQEPEEEENRDKSKSLDYIAAQLVQPHILESNDKQLELCAACCMCDIIRIYVPYAPYDGENLKVCTCEIIIYVWCCYFGVVPLCACLSHSNSTPPLLLGCVHPFHQATQRTGERHLFTTLQEAVLSS